MRDLNESNIKSLLGKLKIFITLIILSAAIVGFFQFGETKEETEEYIKSDSRILHHVVNLDSSRLAMFWKDEKGKRFKNANGLKRHLDSLDKKLTFCMNGGMFSPKYQPAGLYIEKGLQLNAVNRVENAHGNFHMVPNGVFFIEKDKTCQVLQTKLFKESSSIEFATQSGPMLLINGEYHPKFNEGSKNLNIRNGVGVLPNGNVLFAMSTEAINFYDFATFFKINGCQNALYLDGSISKTYFPEKGRNDLGGNFGVLIGEFN